MHAPKVNEALTNEMYGINSYGFEYSNKNALSRGHAITITYSKAAVHLDSYMIVQWESNSPGIDWVNTVLCQYAIELAESC